VDIHSLPKFAGYRLFLPKELIDGRTVDELVAKAEKYMAEYMRDLAEAAGAGKNPKVSMTREDRIINMGDREGMCLGSTLVFTVKGEARGTDL
jgi:hypothetical protein